MILEKGDYPVIGVKDNNGNVVPNYADQMIFWVMNDKGNIHGRTGGQALGVQVNAIAFAFQTNDEVNNMTFYSFDIVKKTLVLLMKHIWEYFVILI